MKLKSQIVCLRYCDPFLKLITFLDYNINLGHPSYSCELLVKGRKLWRDQSISIHHNRKEKTHGGVCCVD